MSARIHRHDAWDEEEGAAERPYQPLTREQARALRAQMRLLSPWRVIAVQAAAGLAVAALGAAITGRMDVWWSALYGAATVVVPGALLARGMTSRLSSLSPGVSAVSFMLWEFAKIGASIAMLALAPQLVQPLSWPALLVSLVICIKVNWLALLWRPPAQKS